MLIEQHLDTVATLAHKDEDLTTHWVTVELIPHQATQPVEALAHVGGCLAQQIPMLGREGEHQ